VVQTARRDPDAVEVVEGLAAGDSIVQDALQGKVARIEPTSTTSTLVRTVASQPAQDASPPNLPDPASDPTQDPAVNSTSRAAE